VRLKDKVSLITGADLGIGQATALEFVSEDAVIVIVDRDLQETEKTQHLIEHPHEIGQAIGIDITQEQQIAEVITKTVKQFGQLNILHNNAGVSVIKLIIETTEAD
jgi:NADP-dependent 3-hydroxy acid dehydrogenase YdfG